MVACITRGKEEDDGKDGWGTELNCEQEEEEGKEREKEMGTA